MGNFITSASSVPEPEPSTSTSTSTSTCSTDNTKGSGATREKCSQCGTCLEKTETDRYLYFIQNIINFDFTAIKDKVKAGFELNKEYVEADLFSLGYEVPLIKACARNNFGMIQFLIKHGADVNFVTRHGLTPLTALCAFNYATNSQDVTFVDTLKFLIEHGALKTVDQTYMNEDNTASSYLKGTPFIDLLKVKEEEVKEDKDEPEPAESKDLDSILASVFPA